MRLPKLTIEFDTEDKTFYALRPDNSVINKAKSMSKLLKNLSKAYQSQGE